MNGISIPGSPGTAMALAAGASIYSTAIVQGDKTWFLWLTLIFILATIIIECMHIKKELRLQELKNRDVKED